jgi:hypothetical protein
MGPAAALAGVHIWTGFLTASGEQVVSSLVQRLGSLDFVNDNTGCFANGSRFPKNGRIISFGAHHLYLGSVSVNQYPSKVLEAPDPTMYVAARGSRTDRTACSVEVLVARTADAGKGAAGESAEPTRFGRQAKHPLEREQNGVGTSHAPPAATPLQVVKHASNAHHAQR